MPAILLVKVADAPIAESPGRWKGGMIVDAFPADHVFTPAELPSGGNFYHVTVSDKNVNQVDNYLERWNHKVTYEPLGRAGNVRRYKVISTMVSVSGKNAFERAPIEAFMDRWNATYVAHDNTSFTMDVDLPDEAIQEARDDMDRVISEMQFARRRWYLTPQAMNFLSNNDGATTRTAVDILPFLRDGLLD